MTVAGAVSYTAATVAGKPAGTIVASLRAYSSSSAGLHTLTVTALQSDGSMVSTNVNLSNMNVAMDKINQRRNPGVPGVVDDFGFPDQPMLDEMADKALQVLSKNTNGFVAMIEGGSIDKMSHLMDTERWIIDALEFDRAIARCKAFAESNPDTLVIVTADHECAGVNIIGASRVTHESRRLDCHCHGSKQRRNVGVPRPVNDHASSPLLPSRGSSVESRPQSAPASSRCTA